MTYNNHRLVSLLCGEEVPIPVHRHHLSYPNQLLLLLFISTLAFPLLSPFPFPPWAFLLFPERPNIVQAPLLRIRCHRNFFSILTSNTPGVAMPLSSSKLMRRYPDCRRSRRMQAHAARSSLINCESSILNLERNVSCLIDHDNIGLLMTEMVG